MLFEDLYNALSKTHKGLVEIEVRIVKAVIAEYRKSRSDELIATKVIEVLNGLKKMDENIYRVVAILYEDEIAEVRELLKA